MSRSSLTLVFCALLALALFLIAVKPQDTPSEPLAKNGYKNASYVIDGRRVQLVNGVAIDDMVPGSAAKITTRYFGNDFQTDLNGDGWDDIVFVVTQDRGGSGTFYYAVAALNTVNGYQGSDGYYLGDRIVPQTTTLSPNPRHKYVVVLNYADRKPDEPMSAQPSVAKSVYLKLDAQRMQWANVEPNFEGETR